MWIPSTFTTFWFLTATRNSTTIFFFMSAILSSLTFLMKTWTHFIDSFSKFCLCVQPRFFFKPNWFFLIVCHWPCLGVPLYFENVIISSVAFGLARHVVKPLNQDGSISRNFTNNTFNSSFECRAWTQSWIFAPCLLCSFLNQFHSFWVGVSSPNF